VQVEDLDPYWVEEAYHTRSLGQVEDLDPYWAGEAYHTRSWEQKEAHAHIQSWEARMRGAWDQDLEALQSYRLEVQNWISLAVAWQVAYQEPPCGRAAYCQVLAVHRDHPLALEHLQEEQNQEACCRTVKRARLSV